MYFLRLTVVGQNVGEAKDATVFLKGLGGKEAFREAGHAIRVYGMAHSRTKIAFDMAVNKEIVQLQVGSRMSNVTMFMDVDPQLVAVFCSKTQLLYLWGTETGMRRMIGPT